MPVQLKAIGISAHPLANNDLPICPHEALAMARDGAPATKFMVFDPGRTHHGYVFHSRDLEAFVEAVRIHEAEMRAEVHSVTRAAKGWRWTPFRRAAAI